MTFDGFPAAAFAFYDGLEADNSKTYWTDHKAEFDTAVQAPLLALLDTLAPEFGRAKVFRPYRDVRFSADKSPYKTHQGAFVEASPGVGLYVQVSATGVLVGGGFHDSSPGLLHAVRAGIDDDTTGPRLESVVTDLTSAGWQLGGETLRTAPRGVSADHPRIALLRHKQLTLGKEYGPDDAAAPTFVDDVRGDWRALRPFVDWVADAAAGATR